MGEAVGQYYLNSENLRMTSKVQLQADGMQAPVYLLEEVICSH